MGRAILVRFSFRLDDVGIGAGIAVKSSDAVIIEGIGSQASHILTSHIAYVAIVIAGNVSGECVGRGNVQPVTARTTYAGPVRSKGISSFIAVV